MALQARAPKLERLCAYRAFDHVVIGSITQKGVSDCDTIRQILNDCHVHASPGIPRPCRNVHVHRVIGLSTLDRHTITHTGPQRKRTRTYRFFTRAARGKCAEGSSTTNDNDNDNDHSFDQLSVHKAQI